MLKLMTKHADTHEFLNTHNLAVLSTVAKNGHPWGSAIYVVADEDFNFYFVTRAETYKYQNIEAQPIVALTIADEDTQTTVQVVGEVSQVPANEMLDIAFNKLAKIKHKGDDSWIPPIYKVHKGDYMVLKLTPSSMQYADYSKVTKDLHQEFIQKII